MPDPSLITFMRLYLWQGTAHMKHMERMAEEMMAEVQNGTYPAAGVSALAACRAAPRQPEREEKWW